MANPHTALNENFIYNSMLARGLIRLLPSKNRAVIDLWMDKLSQINNRTEAMTIRNDYMWMLLIMLQNNRIVQPFDTTPPRGELKPLSQIVPSDVYEELLETTDQNFSWIDKVISSTGKIDVSHGGVEVMPEDFLENQPTPKKGIICYMGAFSDYKG